MAALKESFGRARWTWAEYLEQRAEAFTTAAEAAVIIGEDAKAAEWRNKATEDRAEAANVYAEAKKLGYFGPASEEKKS